MGDGRGDHCPGSQWGRDRAGRRHLRNDSLAPLAGMFFGLAAAAVAGAFAAVAEWTMIDDRPAPSLRLAAMALPMGIAIGATVGLVAGRATASAAVLSGAILAGGWFLETSHAHLDRWRWTLGAACAVLALTSAAIAFRKPSRGILRAPIKGFFAGLVGVTFLAAMLASIHWLEIGSLPRLALCALGLAGLPTGALFGLALGLVGWIIVPRAPSGTSEGPAPEQHPPFQFGLRTLLLGVAAVAVMLWVAGLVIPMRQNYVHDRAVRALGIGVEFDAIPDDWLTSFLGGRLETLQPKPVRSVSMNQVCTDGDLALLGYLPELRELRLSSSRVTDAGLAHLLPLRELESLSLACPQVTPEGRSVLAELPRLRWLRVDVISDEGLERLSDFASIESLAVFGNITDAGLEHVSKCTTVESLVVFGDITDAGFEHLARMKSLRSLRMRSGRNVTGKGLAQLASLPNFESLDLTGAIRDSDLAGLAGLRRLRDLSLRLAMVTDDGMDHLTALPSLPNVILEGCQITTACAARLRQALQARDPTAPVLLAPWRSQ